MATLYDRLRGHDDQGNDAPKLAVWPTLMSLTRVIDAQPADRPALLAAFAVTHELDAGQQAELVAYLGGAEAVLTGFVQQFTSDGIGQTTAALLARAFYDARLRHALINAELSLISRAEFDAVFGL